jgi:hypothetical protein
MRRQIIALLIVGTLFIALNSYGMTLREELEKHEMDITGVNLSNLDKQITSFEVLNNSELFLIAYYVDKGGQFLEPILHIGVFHKSTHMWDEKSLDLRKIQQQYDRPAGGPIMDIRSSPAFFYLKGHKNPSASIMTVLTRDLAFHDGFLSLGNILATFTDETVLYQNFQVHFAPWPHPTEFSLYFPSTRTHQKIYPLEPFQAIRVQHIDKVKAEYQRRGEEWFRSRRHNWNPEEFGERLDKEHIFVNNHTHSLAFIVSFSNLSTWKPGWEISAMYCSDTRHRLEREKGTPLKVSEDVLASFFRNLRAIAGNTATEEDFLALFDGEPALQHMIQQVWDTPFERGKSWKTQLFDLNANWGNPNIWQKFVKRAIEFPSAPSTPVVYIYKNLIPGGKIEYREFLLEEFTRQYGDCPLSEFLTPEGLDIIFHK